MLNFVGAKIDDLALKGNATIRLCQKTNTRTALSDYAILIIRINNQVKKPACKLRSRNEKIIAEDTNTKGRIDLRVFIDNKVYIFEFKVDGSNALQQIKDKNYH